MITALSIISLTLAWLF